MAISHGFNKTEAATSVTAPVTVNSGLQIVVGTAPVNMLDDPEAAVNTPLLVNTFKEAAAAVGYSSDFAKYTLCETVSASFQVMGISPIVVVNVLDPANAKHITELSNKTVQVNDGIAEIDETGILLKKLVVKKEQTVLTADEDYTASFNDDGTVSIALVNGGKGDGATALTVSGSILDPTKITAADIVGGVNAATGAETGLEVVRQVFPKLGMVPGILLAPRFSKDPMVCAALQAKCRKINGVFDAVCFVDIDSSASGARKYTDVANQKVKQGATSREAYEYFASSWRSDVADTKIVCKEGYTIHIYFLMAGGRVPTREECTGMQEYFDTVKRPMGDLVLCHAPKEIPYDIELTYHIALSNVKNASTIQENVEAAVKEYETWQRKIGRDIEPAELIMRVREAGAKRPRLLTPVETTVSEIQVAKLRSCKVTYGGIEDD